jgi:phosphoribosylformylglycinamidine synthase
MPKNMAQQGRQHAGDLVVLLGGRTGRDGIHGVTFASESLSDSSTKESFSSVQIGDPITEKKMLDAILIARDRGLFCRITDCGGGGLSSAVGEMAEKTGVEVFLDKVPLKYAGLSYSEIWISESQERMIVAVPPECLQELKDIMHGEGVELTVIGHFTNDQHLKLFFENHLVGDLRMDFLHGGLPQRHLKASYSPSQEILPEFTHPSDLNTQLLRILAMPNIASKEWVIRQYDHEVQGSSVVKPLVGKFSDGPSDAAIVKPVFDSKKGVIVSNGINPEYGILDTYWMAASAIDEALRQIIAVGGDLKRVALLDNFCWGSVSDSESLGALVKACQACADMAMAYNTPFISGKDSLNNQYRYGSKTISIPYTLLISAIAIMDNTERAVTMDFKSSNNLVYIIGETFNELGGSHYYLINNVSGGNVPKVRVEEAVVLMNRLSKATEKGLIEACHDLSEGGLAVALVEMAFSGSLGVQVKLREVPLSKSVDRDDVVLFAESNSRFLVEVAPSEKQRFEKVMKGSSFACIGQTTNSDRIEVTGLKGEKVIDYPINIFKEAWQQTFRW